MPARVILEGLLSRTRRPQRRAELEAELACPPFPRALDYLWRIYGRLRRRKANGFGLSPIEWPDIDAFMRNTRFPLRPWEIEMIEMLDDVFVEVHTRKLDGPDRHRTDD